MTTPDPLTARSRMGDCLILIGFCALLFGFNCFSGQPLSLHEARLPETSREMLANHDWIIPRSGGRPWLERPPLPHWLTIAVSKLLGQHCDRVWVVRLPAAIVGLLIVLLTASTATRWFGRGIGLCSGLLLATCFEFYRYATLAEDDIYLGLLVMMAMWLFTRLEADDPPLPHWSFISNRSWRVAAFFATLGLTNLAKGPLVGVGIIGAAVGTFLIWEAISHRSAHRLQRYLWIWGWLIFLTVTLAWPLAVIHRYPAVKANWAFDYAGTDQYDQPFWYYPITLLGSLAPWTPAVICGGIILWRMPGSPTKRLLICWIVAPVILLSIPHRKHHHYLVPTLPPWAILASLGLKPIRDAMFRGKEWSRRPIFGLFTFGIPIAIILFFVIRHFAKANRPFPPIHGYPLAAGFISIAWLLAVFGFYLGLHRRSSLWTLGSLLFGIAAFACWRQAFFNDLVTPDTQFLQHVEAIVPSNKPLMVNADLHGELDFFRNQFYLRPTATLLHNLTFLRDQKLTAPKVDIVTRAKDETFLKTLGQVRIMAQSERARRNDSSAERFTLFELTFDPNLLRYPAPSMDSIDTLQAMGRRPGPWCGPTDR